MDKFKSYGRITHMVNHNDKKIAFVSFGTLTEARKAINGVNGLSDGELLCAWSNRAKKVLCSELGVDAGSGPCPGYIENKSSVSYVTHFQLKINNCMNDLSVKDVKETVIKKFLALDGDIFVSKCMRHDRLLFFSCYLSKSLSSEVIKSVKLYNNWEILTDPSCFFRYGGGGSNKKK